VLSDCLSTTYEIFFKIIVFMGGEGKPKAYF
jgi:hypothetical protein